ncbi:MAG: translocation/assembly module TamB [Alphaproteobacteria bacterium]|jgi:autotransporter translocation and assembly factor TamB|nr:translocation/assembly module TamB [Alphaproteobacteria bacterium]
MKFWGWFFRMFLAVLGISLFLLQSQFAKKSILGFIVNQPVKDSPYTIEVEGIRGLFPFQFSVASLEFKDGEERLAMVSDLSVVWLMPSLMTKEIKVTLTRGNELAGDLTYVIGKHALFANLQGDGLPLGPYGVITSLNVDFPTLDLLKGHITAIFHDGQESVTLTLLLEELDAQRLQISKIHLVGKDIQGQGQVMLFPKQSRWEGEAELHTANLAPYDRWVQKGLQGAATLKYQQTLKGEGNLDLTLEGFHYGTFGAKSLKAHGEMDSQKHLKVSMEAKDAVVNAIPMTTITSTGTIDKVKATFEVIGRGQQNISLLTQGVVNYATLDSPHTKITLNRAELTHPIHQFSLKQPATFVWGDGILKTQKVWLTTSDGVITLQDLILGDQLSGDISIEKLPLTLLRVIDPQWIATGSLSGKGALKGTMDAPDIALSLEGKSLQWGLPTKSRKGVPNRTFAIDIMSTFRLVQGFLSWQVKVISGRMLSLICEGKLSVDQWFPTATSTLESTLKGQGDVGLISLFLPFEDLIQGHAVLDLLAKGKIKEPVIQGQISVVNGLYENAAFGTLIKNIKIQGSASGDTVTVSSITGQDNSKGRVNGQCRVKFTTLLNPDIDLQLNLDQLIVVQNDELSGKASGVLNLRGFIWGDEHTKAKITGDVVVKPFEVRLDEHDEKIVTIKLLEKKRNGTFQTAFEHQKQAQVVKGSSFLPLDIKLSSPGQIFIRGYGFDAQWKGEMRALGTITEPRLVGEIELVRGKFDLAGKPLKLSEGRITFSPEPKNDPILSIVGTRDVGEMTATMRIEGQASNPKITFSSSPALPQEEILARLLFAKGIESMSVTQSLLLANALNTFKGKNNLNFTEKVRSAFGLDILEFKERKNPDDDEFKSATQLVSVGKQITDKVYLSLDQSVSGEGGTTAIIQYDVTPTLKIEAGVGGEKNSNLGFAWVKKY